MSTYPIIDPLDILLSFTSSYPIPEAGTSLTLRFGTTGDAEIISEHSEILLTDNGQQLSMIVVIFSEDSEIQIDGSSTEVEIIIELQSDPSEIKIGVPEHAVEHLPDIITAASDFLTLSGIHSIGGGQANDLPNKLGHTGHKMPWLKAQNYVSRRFEQPWEKPIDTRVRGLVPWDQTYDVSNKIESPYINKMEFYDGHNKTPWGDFVHLPSDMFSVPFIMKMDYVDDFEKARWEGFVERNKQTVNPYTNTAAWRGDYKDSHLRKHWDRSKYYDKRMINQFDNGLIGQFKTRHHGTYWGPKWYSMFCQEQYFPWKSREDIKLVLKTDVPFMENLDFVQPNNPRCPFDYWYTGGRDSFDPDITPIDGLFTPIQKVYYMLNSAFIKRLPGNEDIEFESVNISIDRNSWTWSFDITISSKDYLDLIKPSGSTLVDIQININGWQWTCRVEDWSESISFGRRSWSVSGRSPSVELGEPYFVEPSFSNIEEHGGQIVDRILSGTGWSANWDYDEFNPYTEWLIPASALNLYDSSKIHQMQTIIQSVNAFVQTNADTDDSQEFLIKPKYWKNPWKWSSDIVPAVMLNDSVCHEIGRSNKIIKTVNSVIVSGDNQGIIVDAVKDGTAGDMAAPMDINSLITTQDAGRERARHIIGNSGFWINHSMRLFSLMPPGQAPGLLLPGTFIQMSETGLTPWIGQTTGVMIIAQWNNGLNVSQTIEVEQFYG
jgi:hypothetical protein